MTGNSGFLPDQPVGRDDDPLESLTRRPPEALMWFNPFVAQLDVICGTETGFGGHVPDHRRRHRHQSAAVNGDIGGQQFGVDRDTLLAAQPSPRCSIAALLLIVLSVQLVSPTRRWRLRRAAPRAAGPPRSDA